MSLYCLSCFFPSNFRFLSAARDIKAGEVILEEDFLTRCPPYSTLPICLGCYIFIDKSNYINCPTCNWPMCSDTCCKAPDHLLECALFKEANFKVDTEKFNFDTFEPLYDVLTPLRALSFRKSCPDKWKIFLELMSHEEDWKSTENWIEEHKPASDFILGLKLKNVDQQLIWKIFGICYTNEFSTKVNDARVRLTYRKVAMLSHDCTPNVTRYLSGFGQNNKIKIMAIKDIVAGEKLAITYVDVVLPGLIRRDILRKV